MRSRFAEAGCAAGRRLFQFAKGPRLCRRCWSRPPAALYELRSIFEGSCKGDMHISIAIDIDMDIDSYMAVSMNWGSFEGVWGCFWVDKGQFWS